MKIFRFRYIFSLFFALFLIVGGYFGYLSALVDKDEVEFLSRVRASTDKALLEQQLARAQSILDARSRAYIRRSQEFIKAKQAEQSEIIGEEIEPVTARDVEESSIDEINRALIDIQRQLTLDAEDRQMLQSLAEESEDVGFFEDEVETIESMLARGIDEDELDLALAELKKRRRLSGALRELLQLLDKRRELIVRREEAKKTYSYWERNPQSAPSDVIITVKNKGVVPHTLNPLHVTQLTTALSTMPQGFDQRLRTIYVVYGDPKMRRGMSGVGVVFMKGEESDFFRVLVHEFGHIWDLHREVGNGTKSVFYDGSYRLFNEDPSVTYYQQSWSNSHERSVNDKLAFASSYGYTDPFEDFAEAYALYVLQGDSFRAWKNEHGVLARKYEFLFDVFNYKTFRSSQKYSTRPYDVTMLSVNYDDLLE